MSKMNLNKQTTAKVMQLGKTSNPLGWSSKLVSGAKKMSRAL